MPAAPLLLHCQDAEFSIYPRLDRLECSAFIPGPVRSSSNAYYDPLFPDLSTWDFVGLVPLAGKSTQMWQSQRKQGDKVCAVCVCVEFACKQLSTFFRIFI